RTGATARTAASSARAGGRLRDQSVQHALMVQIALAVRERQTWSGLEAEGPADAVELAVDREQRVHRALFGQLLERLRDRVADDPGRDVVGAEGDVRAD